MQREGAVGVYAAAVIVVLILLAPALYVLSVGPVVRLVHHEIISENAAETAYFPLVYLAENCEPIESAISAYVELWEPPSVGVSFPVPTSINGVPLPPPSNSAPLPP